MQVSWRYYLHLLGNCFVRFLLKSSEHPKLCFVMMVPTIFHMTGHGTCFKVTWSMPPVWADFSVYDHRWRHASCAAFIFTAGRGPECSTVPPTLHPVCGERLTSWLWCATNQPSVVHNTSGRTEAQSTATEWVTTLHTTNYQLCINHKTHYFRFVRRGKMFTEKLRTIPFKVCGT